MSYFLAPALVQLRDEVNEHFPRRDKTSDGWIGDPSHAARVSDHNPDWNDTGRTYGIVRAIDVDIDDNNPGRDLRRELLNACVGDPRVWYVISNGIIYSSTYGFAARRYTGANGHFAHLHVSLRHRVGEFDTRRWLTDPAPKVRPWPIDVSRVRHQFLVAAGAEKGRIKFTNAVARIQRALADELDRRDVAVDGLVGRQTLDLWGDFEARRNVPSIGRPRVPDWPSLRILARGRFRLIP